MPRCLMKYTLGIDTYRSTTYLGTGLSDVGTGLSSDDPAEMTKGLKTCVYGASRALATHLTYSILWQILIICERNGMEQALHGALSFP